MTGPNCTDDGARPSLRALDGAATPAIIGGLSRGARVALRFALRHDADARALLLWGLSAGPLAVRFLDELYLGKVMRAAEAGGMCAVCTTEPYAAMVAHDADRRDELLALDPAAFLTAMDRRRVDFLRSARLPVMGFTDDELRAVTTPTVIVPHYDRAHPGESVRHAERTIPNSLLVDFAPERRERQADHGSGRLPERLRRAADHIVVAEILAGFVSDLPGPAHDNLVTVAPAGGDAVTDRAHSIGLRKIRLLLRWWRHGGRWRTR